MSRAEGHYGLGDPDCNACGGYGTIQECHGPPHNPVPSGWEERCDCRDDMAESLFDDPLDGPDDPFDDDPTRLNHSTLELDPFDEGYVEDTEIDGLLETFRVPYPEVELDAEEPTIVGYPAPPLPEVRP